LKSKSHLEDTALALDVGDHLCTHLALVAGTGSVGGVRSPLAGGTGSGLLEHAVDLLKGETLGLGDEEIGVDEGEGAETSPDEEDAGLEITVLSADHVRGDDGDDGIPEPVGGGGESDTTGTDREREDLTDDDPGTGTPGGGEEEDEDGDEGNLGVDGSSVVGSGERVATGDGVGNGVGLVETNGDTNDGNEELAEEHTKGTPEEERTTTEFLHGEKGDGSRADIDKGEDQGDQESVANGTSGLQEDSGVVEDEVDTGPLLHHLHGSSQNGATNIGARLEERTTEAVRP